MAIFEFFGKNAADWCRRCFEIRIYDMEHFAPKFRIWLFWVENWSKMKSLKKLQNMLLGRPGCSERVSKWFLESSMTPEQFSKKLHFCDFKVIFGCNSHAPMLSRLLRGASHLLLCKEHRGPNVCNTSRMSCLLCPDQSSRKSTIWSKLAASDKIFGKMPSGEI